MAAPDPRTLGFLRAWSAYRARYPGETDLEVLRRMDARILPIFTSTIETPPLPPLTTKLLLTGFVDFVDAMDTKLVGLGHAEFRDHERIAGAKNFFGRPDIDVSNVLQPVEDLGGKSPLQTFAGIRASLWAAIP